MFYQDLLGFCQRLAIDDQQFLKPKERKVILAKYGNTDAKQCNANCAPAHEIKYYRSFFY